MSTEAIIEATSADVTYMGRTISIQRHGGFKPNIDEPRWTFPIRVPTINAVTPINNASFRQPNFATRDEAITAAVDFLRDLNTYLKDVEAAESQLLATLTRYIPDLADPEAQR